MKDFTLGKRIAIVGCGGSGKSYLSEKMGEMLGIEVFHLDKLYWKPSWVERDKAEFDGICREIYKKDSFIIDGNFMRTMPERMENSDTLIWLDFSTIAAVRGVLSRVIKNYGHVRPDMGDGCPERFDLSFIKWIVGFRKKTRPKVKAVAEKASADGKTVVILHNRREVNEFCEKLRV